MDGSADDLKEFFIMLRRALLIIVRWIEKQYGIPRN
jgi:hypothetical protein